MTNFTFGCDPEVFVKKRGTAVSAYGLIPGTKKQPHPVSGGAIHVDGMVLEINTDTVALGSFSTSYYAENRAVFEDFELKFSEVLAELRSALAKKYTMVVTPTQEFSEKVLREQPEEALALGCEADYNAYTLEANPRPDGDVNFRTGAGHIHVGWGKDIDVYNPDHFKICAEFIKVMDSTVGLYMTILDPCPKRRELYGKAGTFRPKSYGVEYRTPSNVWIKNKKSRKDIINLTTYSIHFLKNLPELNPELLRLQEEIQSAINRGDAELARQLFAKVHPSYPFNI
jgi:Phage phiEco32-like COOH.NH2 ligase-type 2